MPVGTRSGASSRVQTAPSPARSKKASELRSEAASRSKGVNKKPTRNVATRNLEQESEFQSESPESESEGDEAPTVLDAHRQKSQEITREKASTENPIAQIDKTDVWIDVEVNFDRLSDSRDFETPEFKKIVRQAIQLGRGLARSTSIDEFSNHLDGPSHLCPALCSEITNFSAYREDTLQDFRFGGLKKLVNVLVQIVCNASAPLLDLQDVKLIGLTIEFCRAVVHMASAFQYWARTEHRAAGPTFTSVIIGTLGAMKRLQKVLAQELEQRQNKQKSQAFKSAYAESRKRRAAELEEQRHRLERLNTLTVTGDASPSHESESPEVEMEPIKASPPTALDWTEAMDEELIQCLCRNQAIALPERYQRCLLSPGLQNLLCEHIRARALSYRPSLICWYEERDQQAPAWVTSLV